ncbi:MAG: pyridoxal phosphate-dependent aminotransferase [Deltaproteobacteria bacterium]|nr:pyridoxal phosphate-dependent aminotransferase [Deltaproteobacteria bacterium]
MTVSTKIATAMERGSWIRRMFEEGARLRREHGPENVFDFSLGNPDLPPPAEFRRVLLEEAAREAPLIHCYMPNAGFEETRRSVAERYAATTGLQFRSSDVVMTCGAAGGCNVILKSLLEPEDEVIVLAPYFVEYGFYTDNHGGRMVVVPPAEDFQPDLAAIEARVTSRTRAIIVNSPNNPTGVLYPPEVLASLGDLLRKASARNGREIYLVSDEPYREIVFDSVPYPSPFLCYENVLVVSSHSKDLSLAGERIGHVAVSPGCAHREKLAAALTFCNRVLGFVNANALMQRVVARIPGALVDIGVYERRRDRLCSALADMGFRFVRPQGAFYLFPRSPLADDVEFCAVLRKYRVIVVPGTGFACPGHFRISFAVNDLMIDRSLEHFGAAARELGMC